MLPIAMRRPTNARALAISLPSRLAGLPLELRLEGGDGLLQPLVQRLAVRPLLPRLHVGDRGPHLRPLLGHEVQELLLPRPHLAALNLVEVAPGAGVEDHHLIDDVYRLEPRLFVRLPPAVAAVPVRLR